MRDESFVISLYWQQKHDSKVSCSVFSMLYIYRVIYVMSGAVIYSHTVKYNYIYTFLKYKIYINKEQ